MGHIGGRLFGGSWHLSARNAGIFSGAGVEFSPNRCEVWTRPEGQAVYLAFVGVYLPLVSWE